MTGKSAVVLPGEPDAGQGSPSDKPRLMDRMFGQAKRRRSLAVKNPADLEYQMVFDKFAHLEYMEMNPKVLSAMLTPPIAAGGLGSRNDTGEHAAMHRLSQKLIVRPQSTFKMRWDLCVCVAALFEAFLTPLEVSFHVEIVAWIQTLRRLGDVIFLCDMLLGFSTSYVNEHSQEETKRLQMAKHYIAGWFVLDLISSIPLDLLMSQNELSTNILFKLLKVPRIVRMVKVGRMVMEMVPHMGLLGGIVQLVFFMYLLTHWSAAAFVQVVEMSTFSTWEQNHLVTQERGVFVIYSMYM
jgi:hypothetical protein